MSAPGLQPLDRTAWTAALAGHPTATAFHRWDFLTLAADVLDARFCALGLMRDGEPIALVPLFERRRGPLCTVNWVPFPYLGPLAAPADLPAALAGLATEARRRRAALVQSGFWGEADAGVAAALEAAGHRVRRDATLVVPVAGRTREQLWSGLRQNGRRDLRRAEAAGLRVRAATEADVVNELPVMLARLDAAGDGAGWPPAVTARAAWDRLAGADGVRMTAAVDAAGTTQAVTVALRQADRLYLWLGAAHRHDRVDPHAPIYWDALCHAAEHGLTAVDLVGAPTPGVAAYKRKFGPREVTTLVAQRERVPGYRAAQRAHGRLAGVLRGAA